MVSAQGVMESGMHGAWIDEESEGHLVNPAQSLIEGMLNDIENQRMINCDESVHGVIHYFSFIDRHQRYNNEKLKIGI